MQPIGYSIVTFDIPPEETDTLFYLMQSVQPDYRQPKFSIHSIYRFLEKGDDLFLLVVLALASYAALPAFVLLTFMACLQTFIFMILTYVYLAGAILISHDEH